MKAKQMLKTLNYLPRWAWYLISFFVAGPFGMLGVYLVFHVLRKMETEQKEDDQKKEEKDSEIFSAHANVQHNSHAPIMDDNADIHEVIRTGRSAMRSIRTANDMIADEALSVQIDSIENSCAQILSILEQRPQLLTQLRSFLRYYLPTTLKLLDARAKLENTASTPKAREIRARISEAIGAIDKAFFKQVEALDAYRFIDLESEMDVLRDMLKADGLMDDDNENSDPFAQVLGGK